MSLSNLEIHKTPVYGFSRETDEAIFEYENRFGAHHYERLGVVVRKARGSWITDINGKKYLDCLAAYSAANLGQPSPPRLSRPW